MADPEVTAPAARWLAALPLAGAVLLASLGLVSTALLLLESFNGVLALVLSLVLTAVALRLLGPGTEQLTRRMVALDLAALVLALAFAGLQSQMSAQNLAVTRDPGVYSVTAKWLTSHDSVDIDTQAELFGRPEALTYPSAGYGPTTTPGHVYAHGTHVLPAVLAVVGSTLGDRVMYRTNALIGALGLLAAYALGRRIAGLGAALAGVALLALTLPVLAFARDTYTEPYSQALVLGGLAVLWRARPGRPGEWAVAGLVLGGSCLARIDAYLVLPFLVIYAGLLLAVAAPGRRRLVGRDVAALAFAAVVPAVLGWLDLTRLAPGYYRDLRGQFTSIMALLVVSAVAAAVLVVVAWQTPLLTRLGALRERTWDRLGAVAAGAVVLVAVALAVRAVTTVSHGITSVAQQNEIAALQIGRVAVDGSRSYAEHAIVWVAWYLGPVAALAALVGTALLLRRALVRRDLHAAPWLLVFLSTSLLYLYNPSITPDQIWAMRRFVPVILPVGAVVATYALGLGLRRLHGTVRLVAGGVVGVLVIAPVLYLNRPFLTVREFNPQLAEIRSVCQALPDDAAVVVIGQFAVRYPMTVRAFCDVPAVAANPFVPEVLTDVRRTLGTAGKALYVLSAEDAVDKLPTTAAAGAPVAVSTIDVTVWVRALVTPPRQTRTGQRELFVGRIGPSGAVEAWLR
ncbi:MAG: hypothetical protein ABIO67_08045 [Mycobacteriales bacterium]